MREEQEACDACYNRLIKHYPEDASILYGRLSQTWMRKDYDACYDMIKRGLQLLDSFFSGCFWILHGISQNKPVMTVPMCNGKSNMGRRIYKQNLTGTQGNKIQLPLDISAYTDAKPNQPCPCGSGKKFKACCKKNG